MWKWQLCCHPTVQLQMTFNYLLESRFKYFAVLWSLINDETRNILEDIGADTLHDLLFLLTNQNLLQLLKTKMSDTSQYLRLISKLNEIYMDMNMSDVEPEVETPSFTLL